MVTDYKELAQDLANLLGEWVMEFDGGMDSNVHVDRLWRRSREQISILPSEIEVTTTMLIDDETDHTQGGHDGDTENIGIL